MSPLTCGCERRPNNLLTAGEFVLQVVDDDVDRALVSALVGWRASSVCARWQSRSTPARARDAPARAAETTRNGRVYAGASAAG